MKLYPESAEIQLEFNKVKDLLLAYCNTNYAKQRTEDLRIHTQKNYIINDLQQTDEYKTLLQQAQYFPSNFSLDISADIKLLSIAGATLGAEAFIKIKRLAENAETIFRWFSPEKKMAYPALHRVIENAYYEKIIIALIDDVFDDGGNVKDTASEDLQKIRMSLYRKRNELRRAFEKVVARLTKAGYSADIEESFSNGRRVVAVFSEHKRQVKGILHGESDTRKTAFVEPEETIELNNEVYSLVHEEENEIKRILRTLTSTLSIYAPLLQQYLHITGEYDFISAKAKLAIDMNANFPNVSDKAIVDLKDAYHPLLLIYNKRSGRQTIPLTVLLNNEHRMLIISGPNAGGKTVTMKTIGLCQLMLQAGMLVPVNPVSEMGIFKQVFIHIGDTQSIEFELSTYSAHLLHMKNFTETANGKTLFFIDELGSGSDPALGGAFAEVILEELNRRHAFGVVTTHYLNLKVMANHVPGIINGSMLFDEVNLAPLYKLVVGKPGSSYTFAIAQRIGLPQHLINRAKKLVDDGHFRLDALLNTAEQDLQKLDIEKYHLKKLLAENEKLKKEMEALMDKEKHQRQLELQKHQNTVSEERIGYLKETERKLKHAASLWKQAENKEDKNELIKELKNILFKKNESAVVNKLAKKADAKYKEIKSDVQVGLKVKMKKNHQVGLVKELRGKRAIVQIGMLPINVSVDDLVVVEEKIKE